MLKLKKILSSLALVTLSACGGGGSEPEQISVEIYGDSITFGPTLETNVSAKIKALHPDWLVNDISAVGLNLRELITGYKEPFPNAPTSYYPNGVQLPFEKVQRSAKYVVLELGTNDALSQRSVEQFEDDLRAAIKIVTQEGRIPVLTGIVGLPEGEFFTKEVLIKRDMMNIVAHELAAEYGIPHANWGEDYRGVSDTYDNVHRTQEASDRLAVLLANSIQK